MLVQRVTKLWENILFHRLFENIFFYESTYQEKDDN